MTLKNMRAKHLKVLAVVLALMLASGNVLLSTPGTRAQGIDLAGIDKSIDPGDDFFGYANGAWSKAAQIPSDRPSYGAFDTIAEKVNARTADLISGWGMSESASASPARCHWPITPVLPSLSGNGFGTKKKLWLFLL